MNWHDTRMHATIRNNCGNRLDLARIKALRVPCCPPRAFFRRGMFPEADSSSGSRGGRENAPEEADSSSGSRGRSILVRAGLTLTQNGVPNESANGDSSNAGALAHAHLLSPSAFAGTAVPPARSEEETCSVAEDSFSSAAMSTSPASSSFRSIASASFFPRASAEPADSLTRLLIAARRSPSSSQGSTFIRRDSSSRQSSFNSDSMRTVSLTASRELSTSSNRVLDPTGMSAEQAPETSITVPIAMTPDGSVGIGLNSDNSEDE